jgi:glycosyltransferase involved in cell wall biosynthesis
VSCCLLYLVGQLHPGGLERQLYYLLQAMDRERYQPLVVVWNVSGNNVYAPQIRALGVALHSFSPELSAAAKLREFRRLVREFKPEVVHSYSFYTNFAAHWATRGTQVIALGSIRSDFTYDLKAAGPWLGRLSSCWPRDQICNNFSAAENVRRSRSLFVPRQLYVVRNGLDLQRFRSVPLPTTGRSSILAVGSLLPVKRWDRILVWQTAWHS